MRFDDANMRKRKIPSKKKPNRPAAKVPKIAPDDIYSPVLEFMKKHKLPLTREMYLNLAFDSQFYKPTHEEEWTIPKIFRKK